ncbi:hypothetical protein BGW80DRAFT_1266220 [Lactifluus volemus]|nr:hypothetical protein BGW80DRAFT_1266220 [Lactifluus volemus]
MQSIVLFQTTAIEVVQMLHARIMEHEQPSDVSLLPPYERLSGDPHEVYTHNRTLHTSFSWLGHAPFSGIRISFVIASFEISRGRIEDGIGLGGFEAFTVRYEGHERNKKHILRAGLLLAYARSVTDCKLPYAFLYNVEVSPTFPQGQFVCFGRPCLFETTIALSPNEIRHSCGRAQDMLDLGKHTLQVLGDEQKHHLSYPPSFTAHGKPDTMSRNIEAQLNAIP